MYTIDDNGNILDDNGEILEDIDITTDYFTQKDEGLEEQPDSFYDSSKINAISVDSSYSDIKTNQQVFNESRELLIKKYNEILNNGEMTNDDAQEIQLLKENINYSYNTIMDIIDIKNKVNKKYEIIKNKSNIDRNELINILTDNGQNTFLYKDNDGNILLDGAQMPEMNTVKQTIDTQNGVIDDLVSIAYVGDNDEGKKTLKAVYSELKQTVDTFDQKLVEINKTESDMKISVNDIKDTVDNHTQTISQLEGISEKESKLEQDLNGFKTTVSNTYGTKEDVTTALQTAEKFSWLVKDGGTSTAFSITNGLIKAISDSNIELSAKKILINGLLAGTGWSVDEEGNLDINDLNIRGDITCEGANFTFINCPTMEQCLSNNATITTNNTGAELTLNSNSITGSSIMKCLGYVPNNLGGHSLTITLKNDVKENIEIGGFYNGCVIFNFGEYKTTGNLYISYNNAKIQLNNVTVMPYTGVSAPDGDEYYYAILLQDAPNVDINSADIYGDSINTNKVGIGLYGKSNLTMGNINFYNCKNNVRNKEMSRLYCASSTGLATSYGWVGFSGSETFLYPSTQAGGQGDGTYPYKIAYNNSQIYYTNVTFCTSVNNGSNTTTSDSTTTSNNTSTSIKTLSCTPNYADCYRHTVYNNWKKDGVARQGDYGYGDCEGFFFYGSQFASVKGKTIIKVEITLKRNSNAGSSGAVTHGVTYHNYSSRTSSAPSGTQTGSTVSLAWGDSKTVTITASAVLDGINAGTIKGFGIKSSYDSTHYSSVSNGQVKIYYKD